METTSTPVYKDEIYLPFAEVNGLITSEESKWIMDRTKRIMNSNIEFHYEKLLKDLPNFTEREAVIISDFLLFTIFKSQELHSSLQRLLLQPVEGKYRKLTIVAGPNIYVDKYRKNFMLDLLDEQSKRSSGETKGNLEFYLSDNPFRTQGILMDEHYCLLDDRSIEPQISLRKGLVLTNFPETIRHIRDYLDQLNLKKIENSSKIPDENKLTIHEIVDLLYQNHINNHDWEILTGEKKTKFIKTILLTSEIE